MTGKLTGELTGELTGMRALVTGGGSGIGAGIVAKLRSGGVTVLVVDLDAATGAEVIADVSTDDGVAATFAAVRRSLGGLDLLVNNVGVAGPTAGVDTMDPAAFDECVRMNLGSAFRCAHSAVPLLRERRGSIINISSTAGLFGYPLRSPYAAAKWGVIGLTKTWAMELGPEGIRVNAICPGSVAGPRMDSVIEREAMHRGVDATTVRSAYEHQVSMRTFVDRDDIAAAVVWLASPAARFVSGQVLSIDGHTETLATI